MARPLLFAPRQPGAIPGFRAGTFTMRLLTSTQDREEAYRLRLRAYKPYLQPEEIPASGLYQDRFDDLETTLHVGAYDGERLAGAMRLCFSRPWGSLETLPCAAHYPALGAVKDASKGALMEVSRAAIDPDTKNTSYRTTMYASFVRAGFIAAEAAKVSTILLATQPAFEKFYSYMLGFKRIGEPALYPPGDFRITLLGGSLEDARGRQKTQNSFFKISADEVASMRDALAVRELLPAVA